MSEKESERMCANDEEQVVRGRIERKIERGLKGGQEEEEIWTEIIEENDKRRVGNQR